MGTRRHRVRLDDDPQTTTPRKTTRISGLTLLEAVRDPNLFKPFFRSHTSWNAWFSFIASLFGLPMSEDQLEIYKRCTNRETEPDKPFSEAWLCVGRRGGKSRALALIATWLAAFYDYSEYLDPGERGVIQVLAADREQAKTILRYVKAFFKRIPMLSRMIKRENQLGLELSNSLAIEVTTASFRSVRGRTVVAALCDEIAFWQSEESANPDEAVIAAIKPAMATIPNAMLLCASSPWAKRGILYQNYKRYFGTESDRVLVWQASTDVMNPEIDRTIIEDAYKDDPVAASSEYGAIFRNDVSSFVTRESVEACIVDGRHELLPSPGVKYSAFIDAAGGTGKDSFCMGIAHKERDLGILDVLKETRPPFSTDVVVKEYCDLLRAFGVNFVIGDGYAGGFIVDAFAKYDVTLQQSAKRKSAIYAEFLPMLNSKRVELLDVERMIVQFTALERSTTRGSSRETIDHPPRGGHDDLCNAAAGALVHLSSRRYKYDASLAWVGGGPEDLGARGQSASAQRICTILTTRGL
jgi:hypothetical protein